MGLLQKLFGTHSENELKRIYPIVDRIEALEPEMQKHCRMQSLRDKTREYKERYAEGESLDDLLPEAYASGERGVLSEYLACVISVYS